MGQKIDQIEKIVTGEQLLTNLTGLYLEFDKAKDVERTKKITQLIKKLTDKEFSIGFCGHFSAGKSSMINELVGSDILPSSPIPTSANLVKVRSDEEIARVYLFNGDVVEFPAPYNIEEIKEFCLDGQDVEWIEIGANSPYIPNGVAILDTPGIDSVDEAHRLSTESALHLADFVFYMMDYNHVQSEVSFHFTKKLQEMNKPLYLIINQIDKHQEDELSFQEFQEGVKQAFHDWGVYPSGIFYTSLKEQTSVHNQLSDLKTFLTYIWEDRDEALLKGIFQSSQSLIDDHLNWGKQKNKEEVRSWEETISTLTTEERLNVFSKIEELKSKVSIQHSIVSQKKSLFQKDLTKLLDNAYLMPFETRELAQKFLEAEQPEFKVGFILTKQKTLKEKEERLYAFYSDLMEKVNAQIDWHVKDLLTKFCKLNNLPETLLNDVYQFNVGLEPNDIRSLVKKGAKISGDALLHFTNDVALECKRKYKSVALEIIEKWIKVLDDINEETLQNLMIELALFEKYNESIQHLAEYQKKQQEIEKKLTSTLIEGPNKSVEEQKQSILDSFKFETKPKSLVFTKNPELEENEKEEIQDIITVDKKLEKKINAQEMVSKIESVTDSLKNIKGLQTVVQQLKEKGARLANQSFTVALFGAFSAGKSSFANALMGTKLLPVSPNPTTATINKIRPVSTEFPHGTVRIQFKDLNQIEGDLKHSLHQFNIKSTSISNALEHIENVLARDFIEPKQKPHYSFLKAVYSGYEQTKNHLGNILFVGLDQFGDFVANEEKSCFVEWIEVFYDCDLTRQGITLVDTPGADSINARHTGVAFEYIKNADAILFVTYYNHAFSKADREFLIQLGRVKDVFELDKMFFLINAADLASSAEELDIVQTYVGNQLLAYGIRQPRLFPISSLLALKEKEGFSKEHQLVMENSGLANFETSFKDFIQNELLDLTVTSAQINLKKARQVLNEYILTAQIGNAEREIRKENLLVEKNKLLTLLETNELEPSKKEIEKEIRELIYYVKQRTFLRFTDMFNESFHPSVLSDESSNIKAALKECLDELTEFVAFDLLQELRATSVRIEGLMKKQLETLHKRMNRETKKIQHSLELTYIEPSTTDLTDFDSLIEGLDYTSISKPLASFKNAKAFYENNGKKVMKEKLETVFQEPVGNYLDENIKKLTEYYLDVYSNQAEDWKRHSYAEIDHYFEGLFDILSEKMNLNELQNIEEKVSEMV